MTLAPMSAVVVDTMVVSWHFDERASPLGERYRQMIEPARVILSFRCVMELRFGALRAGWGEFRRRPIERDIAELTAVQPDDRTGSPAARRSRRSSSCKITSTTTSWPMASVVVRRGSICGRTAQHGMTGIDRPEATTSGRMSPGSLVRTRSPVAATATTLASAASVMPA